MAAEDPAENPCGGWMSVMRRPIVRITRQPPTQVPMAMEVAALMMTQSGVEAFELRLPWATSARVMMPIVFWASFVP